MRATTRRGQLALAIIATLWLAPGVEAAAEIREPDASSDAASAISADNAGQPHRRRGRRRHGLFGSHAAPEIDPGLFAGGAALLVGGTLVLLGHRRRRRASTNAG